MTWLNASMLFGLVLVGIPIIIHLSMRQRPKHYLFPALRFVQQRSETNKRQLRFRHWILLALRCLAVALAVLLLARPSVASAVMSDWILIGMLGTGVLGVGLLLAYAMVARKGTWIVAPLSAATVVLLAGLIWLTGSALVTGSRIPIGSQESPVSAVVVVDTSPRMNYQRDNATRLDEVRATANGLLKTLPLDSQISVLSSAPGPAFFAVDRSAAAKTLEQLRPTGIPRDMPTLVRQAIDLAETGNHPRKEVYVFTDLAAESWSADAKLAERLADKSHITLYVIDVGIEDAANFGLGDLQLSTQIVAGDTPVELECDVFANRQAGTRTIEVLLEESNPTQPFVRDGRPVEPKLDVRQRLTKDMSMNGRERIQVQLGQLPQGVHHGRIRLVEEDQLDIDNTRYFSVVVREPWRMLVVADENTNTTAWTEALAPYELREEKKAAFVLETLRPTELAAYDLSNLHAVCCLDPPPLQSAAWQNLAEFVGGGGGLCMFLGNAAGTPEQFAVEAAVELLGTRPTVVFRAGEVVLAPERYDHPVLRVFQPFATSVPWNNHPVYRHWGLDSLGADSSVVLRYSNREPAIIDRKYGDGRVLLMTTPITEMDQPRGRRPWNDLAGPNDWPRFLLVNQIADFVVGAQGATWTYLAGESATLDNSQDQFPSTYQMMRPNGEIEAVRAIEDKVIVSRTDLEGAYRLKGVRGGPLLRGFSVNVPATASDLTRLESDQLEKLLGKDRYQYVQGEEELERVQGTERAGREFYPFLVTLLVLALGIEQALSNRFYKN